MLVEIVVEPVVAELVEASKRPQKKANESGGFKRVGHQEILILKIDFRGDLLAFILLNISTLILLSVFTISVNTIISFIEIKSSYFLSTLLC